MTETERPSQQPQETLEQKVEQKATTAETLAGLARGIIPPIIGAAGGYMVTHGPGGAGIACALTSLGLGSLINEKMSASDSIADECYKIGLYAGGAVWLVASIFYLLPIK